jgi:5-methylcytosine-specific restriction protein A
VTWSRTSRQSRGYGSAWDRLRLEILKRDDYLCQRCLPARATSATEVHHIREKARGGDDSPSNLISTCATCHREEHGVVTKHGFDRHGRSLDPASPWSVKR